MILVRYILREHVRPFFLGFGVVTFLLTMDFLFDYLDLFLNKGIPLLTVLRLFGLGLGWMLALSLPCGVLVGVRCGCSHSRSPDVRPSHAPRACYGWVMGLEPTTSRSTVWCSAN